MDDIDSKAHVARSLPRSAQIAMISLAHLRSFLILTDPSSPSLLLHGINCQVDLMGSKYHSFSLVEYR
jgi:hypothetical protein